MIMIDSHGTVHCDKPYGTLQKWKEIKHLRNYAL